MLIWIPIAVAIFLLSPALLNLIPDRKLPRPPRPLKNNILKGAEPIEKNGRSPYAFILCHGYNDSPFQVKPLADHLIKKGHTVYAPLLDGHGTRIEDLIDVRYSHWYLTVSEAMEKAINKKKKVFLMGQSLGGSICLHIAGTHPLKEKILAVTTISAPMFMTGFYNGKLIIHKPYLMYTFYMRLLGKITRFQNKTLDMKTCPYIGYGKHYAMDNLHSFVRSLFFIRRSLKNITVPLHTIMCSNDATVRIEDQTYIQRKTKSKIKRSDTVTIQENKTTRHLLLTHTETSKKVIKYIDEFIADNK